MELRNSLLIIIISLLSFYLHIDDVAKEKRIAFSEMSAGCSGASCYFGFKKPNEKAGVFLTLKEKFKENAIYGNEFYQQIKAREPKKKYLILANLEQMEETICVEVVNYWVNPMSLSGLVTLSNYDSLENNNVNIPFASGCQSMWTIPYKEKKKRLQKATVGASDTILFSVPANRFNNMAKNIEKSFANENNWLSTIKKA
jgi:hypothetical protein